MQERHHSTISASDSTLSDFTNYGSIDELDLPRRTYNALRRAGIRMIDDLLALEEEDLFRIRNFGEKAVKDVYVALAPLRAGLWVGNTELLVTSNGDYNKIPAQTDSPPILVEDLGLLLRTLNALRRGGIHTVRTLLATSEDELWAIPNFGPKAMGDVNTALAKLPMSLREPLVSIARDTESVVVPPYILDTSVSDLDLSLRAKAELTSLGLTSLQEILAYKEDELGDVFWKRGISGRSLEEIIRLHRLVEEQQRISSRSSETKESRLLGNRVTLARENGISEIPMAWSWTELLDMGYQWERVQSLDDTLRERALPELEPLPKQTLISVEVVRYLLNIGCPLYSIPALRITFSATYRHLLAQMKLTDTLRVFLCNRARLEVASDDFPKFNADVLYYVEWLGTRSDWSGEISGLRPSPVVLCRFANMQFDSIVQWLLAHVPERGRDIVAMRFGLETGQEHTLQEVAGKYGITRSRAAQIIERYLKIIQTNLQRDELLHAFVFSCKEVIDEAKILSADSFASEVARRLLMAAGGPERVVWFLAELAESASYSKRLDLYVSSKLTVKSVEMLAGSVKNALQRAKAPMRLPNLLEKVISLNDLELNTTEQEELLKKYLEAASQVVTVEDGYYGLRSWETRITDDIVMVLRKLDRPAHFREVTDLVNARLPIEQRTTPRLVYAKLEHYGNLFARVGPGTFVLKEWDANVPSQPVKYLDLIEQVFLEAGTPLSIAEVYARVNAKRAAKLSSIAMYVTMNDRFAKFGSDRYGLAEWVKSDRNDDLPSEAITSQLDLPDDFLRELKSMALDTLLDKKKQARRSNP
jgi:DNA-directed RNA polymerase alpha subunit